MAAGFLTSYLIEVELAAGVWTDITSYVDIENAEVRRRVGRASAVDDISPGILSLSLVNTDGRFTPDNPLSPYYPNLTEGVRIRWKVTKTPTTYTRFTGWITDLEPSITAWDVSTVEVTAHDTLGYAASRTSAPPLEATIRKSLPFFYAKLDEAVAPFVDNAGGKHGEVERGPGTLTLRSEPAITQDGLLAPKWVPSGTPARNDGVRFRQVVPSSFSTTQSYSISYVIQQVSQSGDYNLFQIGRGVMQQSIPGWGPSWNGDWISGSGVSVVDSRYGVTRPMMVHVTCEYSTGNIRGKFYLDGEYIGINVGTLFAPLTAGADLLLGTVTASVPSYIQSDANFALSHLALYDRVLTDAEILDQGKAFLAYGGDTVATAMDQVAELIGLTVTHESGHGPQIVDPLVVTGEATPSDLLRTLARGDGGVLYDDGTGLYARAGSALRPSTAAFSYSVEADGDGATDWTRSSDNQVSQATAQSTTQSATAVDADLVARFGIVSTAIDAPNQRFVELEAIASERVSLTKNKRLRIKRARIDLTTAAADLYATVLTLKLGDRITLTDLPSQQFGYTTTGAYVQGWTEALTLDGLAFVFDLEPADAPGAGKFDNGASTTYDRFGDNGDLTLTANITVGATTMQVSSTAGGALTTTGGSYPFFLNLNGEVVQVTAAPGGGTSPQTLGTIVRGQQGTVARAHTAGEPITVWSAARFVL